MHHILLIEDSGTDALLVREAIRQSPVKARVTIASDGEQALKILNSPGFTPDLIVLDLSVPKLDGMDVLARYRREKGEAPIVVFTNSANPKEQSRAMELGANEYLIKPRELDEYLSTIRGAIERWMGETAANGV